MKIFLIGFMGVGKTTVAKKLANRLAVPVIDLDARIEKTAGATIPEIFKNSGETSFRELEQEVLKKTILSNEDFVMSTGGGAPCFYDNMKLMKSAGCCIWLKLPAKTILQRISKNIDARPLLAALEPTDLQQYIQETLTARSPYYQDADFQISAEDVSAVRLNELVQKIRDFYTKNTST